MKAEEFRKIRSTLELTQDGLAELMDVTPNTISRYETGANPIPKIVEMAINHLLYSLTEAKEFNLRKELKRVTDPEAIMEAWFDFEKRTYPADFGIVFFKGWETFSEDEKLDALKDAKRVLDRTLKQQSS